jgi:hypothetical protein
MVQYYLYKKRREIKSNFKFPKTPRHCSIIHKDELYAYGNENIFIYIYNFKENKWRKQILNGDIPSGSYSTILPYKNNEYLIHGTEDERNSNKMYIINFDTFQIKLLKQESWFQRRDAPMVLLDNESENKEYLIFGGKRNACKFKIKKSVSFLQL